jgi:hypothetical protein
MRPALGLLVLVVAASCAAPLNVAVGPAAPAVWPLRGTAAPDANAIHRRPLVVKVANDPGARPQTGIADADLVFEIPVEGGLTRFALVFQSKEPAKVGPVRSARQSDLNYLTTLHAILAHVGASESVTKMVRDAAASGGFVDIDEFQHADAFERVTDRVAPYNAYTSAAKIRQAAGSAGEDRVDVGALKFGDPQAASADGPTLTIPYAERVRYEFDASRSAYHRTYAGGAKTTDAGAGEVLPENVVVIKTNIKEIPGTADAAGAPSVDYRATGSGPVVVLRDGKRLEGTWSRQGSEMYRFADGSGKEILLKPGLTWIAIVPASFDLSG